MQLNSLTSVKTVESSLARGHMGGVDWRYPDLGPGTPPCFRPSLCVFYLFGCLEGGWGDSESRVFCTTIFNCREVFSAPIGKFSATILPPRIVLVRVHRKEAAPPPPTKKIGVGGLHQWVQRQLGGIMCVSYDLSNVCRMWNGRVWGHVGEPSPKS